MFFIYSLAPRASPSDNNESENFTCEQSYIRLVLFMGSSTDTST